jgi:hypothetical protein
VNVGKISNGGFCKFIDPLPEGSTKRSYWFSVPATKTLMACYSAWKAAQSVATVTRDEVSGKGRRNENLPGRQYQFYLLQNI